MPLAMPVSYRPDVETIRDDEAETIGKLNETFGKILNKTAEDYGRAVRSVHAKAHGILEATFRVLPNLPAEYAQGLFATPAEHKAYLRISTNAGDILPDVISLPRGLALKVLDVEGARLPGAEGTTQDFVMVNGQVFQNKTADKFLKNLKLLAATTDKMEKTKEVMSGVLQGVNKVLTAVGVESPKVQTLGGAPNAHPLGESYFSVTPFRYGDYIAKFSVVPVSDALTKLTDKEIDARKNENAIRHAVRESMAHSNGHWEFRVQLCRDLEKQPIEDPTKAWDEDESPFVTVAVLDASPQDSWEPGKVQAVDEGMRFSVWTGLVAHQPLGNINRARNGPYKHSSNFRAAFNLCPIHEPD